MINALPGANELLGDKGFSKQRGLSFWIKDAGGFFCISLRIS